MYKSTFTASPDGKTLTEAGGAGGYTEKIKVVYESSSVAGREPAPDPVGQGPLRLQ